MIGIKIDNSNVAEIMGRIIQATSHRQPLMRNIAAIMLDAVEENFAQEGRPKWQGLKPPSRDGKILQKSGRLASSMNDMSDNNSSIVGTNVKYAAIQNNGGRTRPHEISPRHKKALAFGGRVVKKVNHPGSDIPARPFMLLTDDDLDEIVYTAESYLRSVAGG
ncbi:phage virion morphogenesis protein [Chromobacterium vaccinii]|uniref:phage virion morphogenesis protein n=1 Tax=Chromobacterium vaccinii TaxID=1108595 RepID=UPI003C783562